MKRRHDPSAPIFYVYALVDPRDGKPFYYGKGVGQRHTRHVKNWRAGYPYNENKIKLDRIGEIVSAGLEVESRILVSGLTSDEALRIEREKIKAAPKEGLKLTNMPYRERAAKNFWRLPRYGDTLDNWRHALRLITMQLHEFPDKATVKTHIARHHRRKPSLKEWQAWLRELRELATMRRVIQQKIRDHEWRRNRGPLWWMTPSLQRSRPSRKRFVGSTLRLAMRVKPIVVRTTLPT